MDVSDSVELAKLARAAVRVLSRQDFIAEVMPVLAGILDAPHSVIYEQRGAGIWGAAGTREAGKFEGYLAYAHNDPLHAIKTAKNPRVAVTTEAIDRHELTSSEVYREFYRPNDIEHQLVVRATPMGYADGYPISLVLARGRKQPRYSPLDLELIRKALPTLEATLWRVLKFEELALQRNTLAALAEEMTSLYAAFNRTGRLLWLSRAAEQDRATLGATWIETLQVAARKVDEGAAQVKLQLNAEQRTLAVGVTDDDTIYFACKRSSELPSELGSRFELSKSEQAVMVHLLAGKSNADIGKALFVSTNTVRTHVGRILKKMRVSSRLEAVTVLSSKYSMTP